MTALDGKKARCRKIKKLTKKNNYDILPEDFGDDDYTVWFW